MIGKQRRRSASVDEQYRPFILKRFCVMPSISPAIALPV